MLSSGSDAVKIAADSCMLYCALVQAYYLCMASNSGLSLKDCAVSPEAIKRIKEIWGGKRPDPDPNPYGSCFSFLQACASDHRVLGEGAAQALAAVRSALRLRLGEGGYRADGYGYEELYALWNAMPLLATTLFRDDKLRFLIKGKRYSMPTFPFLCFVDENNNVCSSEKKGCGIYVLAFMQKGQKNYTIRAKIRRIFDLNWPRPTTSNVEIGLKGSNSTALYLTKLDISPVWNSEQPGEYTVNFQFLIKLSGYAAKLIYKAYQNCGMQISLWGYLHNILKDASNLLPIAVPREETEEELQNVLMELFLGFGIAKTITTIFCNVANAQALFDECMEMLTADGIVSPELAKRYTDECNERMRLDNYELKRYLNENDGGFSKRMAEMAAERRTFAILKAIGLQKENEPLSEKLLSIDDYKDKLMAGYEPIDKGLKRVLLFLNCFYRALMEQSDLPVNEERFKAAAGRYSEEFNLLSVPELVEKLIDLNEEHPHSEILMKAIGRDELFSDEAENALRLFADQAERYGKQAEEPQAQKNMLFVSYCHRDKEFVNAVIERARQLYGNIDYYVDTSRFNGGDDWKEKAQRAILDSKGVIFFFSREAVNPNILFELSYYDKKFSNVRRKSSGNNSGKKPYKKLIPVNLEPSPIDDILFEMWDVEKGNNDPVAQSMNSIITKDTIALNLYREGKSQTSQKKSVEECAQELVSYARKAIAEFDEEEGTIKVVADHPKEYRRIVRNFYASLKTGVFKEERTQEEINRIFSGGYADCACCVYPIVMFVREIRINRENFSVLGYEVMTGKSAENAPLRYMLTEQKLSADSYFCIPHAGRVGSECRWMLEPLLIRYDAIDLS